MRPFQAAAALAFAAAAFAGQAAQPHREFGYFAAPDGVRLAYVSYRPAAEGRYPVLLIYEPYWGGGRELHLREEEVEYVRHGYAVVGVSVRGTGCSGGTYEFMNPATEAVDGAAAVEWAAARPWSDGNVGLYGNSYSGTVQFFIAARRPAHLKAMAAGGTVADRYTQSFHPGGIFNSGFSAQWTFFTQPRVSEVGAEARASWGDAECAGTRRRQPPNRAYYDMAAHPLRDEWWQARAPERVAANITVPMLIVQGWQDQQAATGGPRMFSLLRGPRKLIASNGRHELFWDAAFRTEKIRWFDRWLKGTENGIEKEPAVTLWFESRTRDGRLRPAWTATLPDWPPPSLDRRTLHLQPAGRLAEEAPAEGTRSYFYPSGTEIVSQAGFQLQPSPVGSLVYRSAPATRDAGIAGIPVVTLYAAAEQNDADFMVALHDVDPEGNVTYLQRGFLRASHRALEPGRAGEPPRHPHLREAPLEPGRIYEFRIPLYPVAHVLRRGHALELAVLAPPVVPVPNWGFAIRMLPGRVTVHHSREYPSRLELPVVPGWNAEEPAPGCGSLDMQPCRPGTPPR